MSSSGSDGNMAVIHRCFPLLVGDKNCSLSLSAEQPLQHAGDEWSLTQCLIWAGSGVWAAGLHIAAGGRWSLRCTAASGWDPSLSALRSLRVQTPWTSTCCKLKESQKGHSFVLSNSETATASPLYRIRSYIFTTLLLWYLHDKIILIM